MQKRVTNTCNFATGLASWLQRRFDLPSSQKNARTAALIEVERRAFPGALVYLSSWLGIAFSTGVMDSTPEYCDYITFSFCIIVVLRVALHGCFRWLVAYHSTLARILFLILVLSAGLVTGLVEAATVYVKSLAPAFHPMVVVTGVLCTACTLMLSIDPGIRHGIPVVMLGPGLVAFLFNPTPINITFCILLMVNIAYLIVTSQQIQSDYWNGLQARFLLEAQSRVFESQSLTDGLTRIPNRLHAQRRLSDQWIRSQDEQLPFTTLMVDIDHFKSINDRFGHLFGDVCLVAVADVLKTIIREPDFVARYGGEEFIVVLHDATEDQGVAVAERLRRAISQMALTFQNQPVRITCSIGVATSCPSWPARSVEAVIGRADAALYQAKETGRNRVLAAQRMEMPNRA